MNKSDLKNFAIGARLALLQRVSDRAALYGVTEETAQARAIQPSAAFHKTDGSVMAATIFSWVSLRSSSAFFSASGPGGCFFIRFPGSRSLKKPRPGSFFVVSGFSDFSNVSGFSGVGAGSSS